MLAGPSPSLLMEPLNILMYFFNFFLNKFITLSPKILSYSLSKKPPALLPSAEVSNPYKQCPLSIAIFINTLPFIHFCLIVLLIGINEDKKVLHKVVEFNGSKDKIDVALAFQYNESYNENIVSFVNNVKTIDGGSHEVGLKTALTKVFNDYARNNGFLKAKDKNLEGPDTREGLTAVLSLKIPENL